MLGDSSGIPTLTSSVFQPSSPIHRRLWPKMATGLGIAQLIVGTLCVAFHVVIYTEQWDMHNGWHYIGEGVLTGIVIISAGSSALVAARRKNYCTMITFVVFSVLSGLFSLFPLVFGIIDTAMVDKKFLMMPVSQLILATFEIILSTWSIGLASQSICCNQSQMRLTAQSTTGITQLVASGNQQHVMVFSSNGSQPSVMYSIPQHQHTTIQHTAGPVSGVDSHITDAQSSVQIDNDDTEPLHENTGKKHKNKKHMEQLKEQNISTQGENTTLLSGEESADLGVYIPRGELDQDEYSPRGELDQGGYIPRGELDQGGYIPRGELDQGGYILHRGLEQGGSDLGEMDGRHLNQQNTESFQVEDENEQLLS